MSIMCFAAQYEQLRVFLDFNFDTGALLLSMDSMEQIDDYIMVK